MRKITKSLLILCVLCVLCGSFTGCDFNGGKITPEQLTLLADQVDTLTKQLTVYQSQVTLIAEQMQNSGILDPNDAAKVAKLNAEIDKVKAQISGVTDAIRNGTYNPSDDTLLTILKAAQIANRATILFNPYAPYIELGLTAIIAVLGIIAALQKKKAAAATTALDEVVTGNEVFKQTADPAAVQKFKNAQTTTQSADTAKAVAVITAS